MRIDWVVERDDIRRVKSLVRSHRGRRFVKRRIVQNVKGPAPEFSRESFWEAMIRCLTSTQQRSGPESAVTRFVCTRPFPLDLETCRRQSDLAKFTEETITSFGGLRFGPKIGDATEANLAWLESGGWSEVERRARALSLCRRRRPKRGDKTVEREAAELVHEHLKGFGPKQSRNLWQTLGLTRFETPVDSRITRWLNQAGFPFTLSGAPLADRHYYEFVMDGIQELCRASGVLPCVLDAAIFARVGDEWPEDKLVW